MKLDVISLGEPMIEFSARRPGHLKDANLFERGWGGDTSNFAVAIARLGRKAGYITRIGDDEFGKCFLDLWTREGIDTSNVIIEKGGFTGIYFIAYVNGHEFTYYRKGSAASHLSPQDLNTDYLCSARVFHSSGITQAISQFCRETVFEAAKIAKKSNLLFSFDPNIRLKLWPAEEARDVIERTLELADIVLPSVEDVKILTAVDSPSKAAQFFLEYGPKIVALKVGAEGCVVATERKLIKVPSFEVKTVDATGAGDAFDAAFIVGILEGWEIEETAKFANAVGALTTMGRGAVKPIPTWEKAIRFLKVQSRKNS